MKKVLAIVLAGALMLSMAACSTKSEGAELDMTPTVTEEQLREEVDFGTAKFATAQDGEVSIETGIGTQEIEDSPVPNASFRSELSPDEVWSSGTGSGKASSTDKTTSTSNVINGNSSENFTMPSDVKMSDGSLGKLSIPKINLSVSVYETDSEMEDMAHGVAHFKETSCWNGNVGLAGHNQGVNTYFGQIHTLAIGDTITLTTSLGTRTYAVSKSVEIDETDWSLLGRTEANQITLITCVNHDLTKRLCVQAVEVQ